MSRRETLRLSAGETDQAARILARGGLVALPTETVYGLAADCRNPEAIAAIYRAKGRAESKALSVLLTGMEMAEQLCRDIPPAAYQLAREFWPGPLTMILPDGGVVAPAVRSGGATLGVRAPDHPLTRAVIAALGTALAAPSANRSDWPSPKCAEDVLRQLDGRIDAVLDGGTCEVGLESTILDLTAQPPRILREGALPAELIWQALERAQR